MADRHHVPAYLRDMFCAALEYGAMHGTWWEWFATERADQFLWRQREGGDWAKLDSRQRAHWLLHRLWDSTEIVPAHILALHELQAGATYAHVARQLDRDVGEDTPGERQPTRGGPMVSFHVNLPHALVDDLTKVSEQLGMTKAEIVRQALITWLSGRMDRARGDN